MADIQITGFEMLEKLGEGGTASVWKARQVSLDRMVAIKVLAPRFANDPDDVEMFRREAQQAAKLKHPGIVQVYDAKTENGLCYFVMEYVAGYTVGDWVTRKGRLGEKDILLLAECIASALDYAWEGSRIIHCDIKPHNVMLDDDGTVKVTDLGLARTINAMNATVESEYVLGTPAYMSPEQVTGQADIDFRADIYSLGAMLYHLSTGQIMFHSEPDDRVMELQIEGTVQAPHDLNPDLSKPFCSLIEKMLAKAPENRPASWKEVIKDIGRVKKRLRPIGCLQDGQASSVQPSVHRTEHTVQRSSPAKTKPGPPVGKWVAVAAAVLAVAVLACFVGRGPHKPAADKRATLKLPTERVSDNRGVEAEQEQAHAATPVEAHPPRPAPANREVEAKQKYDNAASWVEANPTRFKAGIDRFETVAIETRGTQYAPMSSEQARELKRIWDREIENVMVRLKNDSAPHIDGGDLLRAATLYETYNGAYRKDTESERLKIASQLHTRHETLNAQKEAAAEHSLRKYEDTAGELADLLLTQGIAPALELAKQAMYDEELANYRKEFTAFFTCLESASTTDGTILESFDAQRGKVVSVEFTAGRKPLSIVEVRDGMVYARQQQGSGLAVLTIAFGVEKLSTKERLGRMGDDSKPDVALVKGLMATSAGSETYAKAFFSKTHPLIANRLMALLEGRASARLDTDAKEALMKGLADLGIKVDPTFDQGAWTTAIEKAPLTDAAAKRASEFADSYTSRYGNSRFYEHASAVVESLAQAEARVAKTRPTRAGHDAPSRLSEKLNRAIVKHHEPVNANQIRQRLLNDNPEVLPDELEILRDADGHVYRINMYSPAIRSIAAVSECKALRVLHCGSVHPRRRLGPERAPLSDLSPIKDLPLESLYLAGTSVKDLSALSAMKLIRLNLRGTRVTSLAPLKQMDLAYIDLGDVPVRDIADLSNMNLEDVDLSGTRVFSFSVLRNKSIRKLNVANTQFKDLSVLRNMPLEWLDLANSGVHDFGLLSTFDCKTLNLSGTQIKDLSALAGMPLTGLRIGDVRARGYEVLRELPLVSLTAAGSSLEDLSSVASPSLKVLDVSQTKVSDLTPIAKMPALEVLAISHSQIQDLGALSGQNLRSLTCRGYAVDTLRPLIRMGRLDAINTDNPEQPEMLPVLFRIPGLVKVNGKPRAFWK
jgi:eukaryotic-like serine/threonine-protein kinase